jgi:hypothetical protein
LLEPHVWSGKLPRVVEKTPFTPSATVRSGPETTCDDKPPIVCENTEFAFTDTT